MKLHFHFYSLLLFTLLLPLLRRAESTQPSFSCDSSDPRTKSFRFCQTSLPIHERVHDLISRLTLDEKISQLVNAAPAVPRLGVPAYEWWSEALHGLSYYGRGISFDGRIGSATSFPQVILSASTFDSHLWYRIAQAIGKEARAFYNEGQAKGMTFWTPNINIFRDPRWGRGQETPGEDPLVVGKYAVAYVRGIQGDRYDGAQNCHFQDSASKHFTANDLDNWKGISRMGFDVKATGITFWSPRINIFRDLRWGSGQGNNFEDDDLKVKDDHLQVSACCKHFTAYDLEKWEGFDRFTFNAQVTKQDMADTYQPPFRNCVEKGRASGIMCAYNLVNGVPNCANYDLLTKTVREEWGFQGYIASDCEAVPFIFERQDYAKLPENAVADVLKAGMDVECGTYLSNHTKSAVQKGKVSELDIDRALHNLFSVRMRLGLFNGLPSKLPYGNLGRKDVCAPEHQALALEAARNGIVLLKNSENLIPLSKSKTNTLTVIGPNANVSQALLGNYEGTPCRTVTPLQGLMSYVKVTKFHQGCDTISCTSFAANEVVGLAKSADFVVLVMGIDQNVEREDLDRDNLVLPGEQESLIMSVAKAAKSPVVLVMVCGGPIDISFAKNEPKIGAILWAGYPGEAGGKAIAEIIFGDHNPGGRLPVTWYPKDFIKIPMTDMRMRPDPSSGYPGRTYRFYQGKKVFEFGYGLSYSNYSYKFISVSQNKLDFKTLSSTNKLQKSGYISVSDIGLESCNNAKFSIIVSVENPGNMAGKHPVLLFVRPEWGGNGPNGGPVKQLVGFQTVRLDAKEKANVKFEVNPCEEFGRANEDGVMVIETGYCFLVVGDQDYPISINI